jgi:radical SAM protein with 4Fe4S-binding SPASM domain
MKRGLYGLANINIELTSRCNKNCWICGRRRIEKEYPELALQYGDMDFDLVKQIAAQIPPHVVVQLHNNGEALLYPRFGEVLDLFPEQITNIVTNGKLLLEKADQIIGRLDTMAVSVFEKDPEAPEQLRILEAFLKIKKDRKPFTVLRINGQVDTRPYQKLNLIMVHRALHSPFGSYNYRRAEPTIPEIGICLDFLHHLAINKDGKVSICVRFDPKGLGVIGDIRTQSLEEIWNGSLRQEWLNHHKAGRRDLIPLCSYCQFWGVPTAGQTAASEEVRDDLEKFRRGGEISEQR